MRQSYFRGIVTRYLASYSLVGCKRQSFHSALQKQGFSTQAEGGDRRPDHSGDTRGSDAGGADSGDVSRGADDNSIRVRVASSRPEPRRGLFSNLVNRWISIAVVVLGTGAVPTQALAAGPFDGLHRAAEIVGREILKKYTGTRYPERYTWFSNPSTSQLPRARALASRLVRNWKPAPGNAHIKTALEAFAREGQLVMGFMESGENEEALFRRNLAGGPDEILHNARGVVRGGTRYIGTNLAHEGKHALFSSWLKDFLKSEYNLVPGTEEFEDAYDFAGRVWVNEIEAQVAGNLEQGMSEVEALAAAEREVAENYRHHGSVGVRDRGGAVTQRMAELSSPLRTAESAAQERADAEASRASLKAFLKDRFGVDMSRKRAARPTLRMRVNGIEASFRRVDGEGAMNSGLSLLGASAYAAEGAAESGGNPIEGGGKAFIGIVGGTAAASTGLYALGYTGASVTVGAVALPFAVAGGAVVVAGGGIYRAATREPKQGYWNNFYDLYLQPFRGD